MSINKYEIKKTTLPKAGGAPETNTK